MAGRLTPGASGCIYLTDVVFRFGWQATDYLALPGKNAEVAIPVPTSALPSLAVFYLGLIPEWPAQNGRSIRRGGGHQWIVTQPLSLNVMPWTWVDLEVP